MTGNSPYFNQKTFLLKGVLHIFCWLLFITYELVFLHLFGSQLSSAYVYLLYYGPNISYFYAFAVLLTFHSNRPRPRYVRGAALLAFTFLMFTGLRLIIDHFLGAPASWLAQVKRDIAGAIFRLIYFSILATLFWLAGFIAYYRSRTLEAERKQLADTNEKILLEKQLLESHNAYLRQQLSPHLLFNSLNFIYSGVLSHSSDAATNVLLLSDLMRYSLEEGDADGLVPLTREIEHIRQLVAINRYRFEQEPALILHLPENTDECRIIPLIFFTLTENVIKHGDLSDPTCPALVEVLVRPGELRYHSKNLRRPESQPKRDRPLGLENTRIRLEFAYPGRHSLLITERDNNFEVSLSLSV